MCKSQRGFTLPIVSAIIGFITAMGSAIFPTFFHNAKQNDASIVEAATSTPIQTSRSAPVQARVASSSQSASPVAKAQTKSPVRQITRTMDAQTAQACQDSQKISTSSGSPASPLTGYIRQLCTQLSEPSPDTQVQTDAWKATEKNVQEKWAILQKSQSTTNTPPNATVPSQPIPAPAPSCREDTWSCDDWSACSPIGTRSGIQTRNCTKTFDCPVDNNPSPSTSQICNPPEPIKIPTPEISYADQHCPKIIKIEDSLGNTAAGDSLSATFKRSDVSSITVKIYATDPQGLPIYYSFSSGGLVENEDSTSRQPSSSDNSFTINVTTTHPGTSKVILYDIDNRDNFLCFGASDARGIFYYTMLP